MSAYLYILRCADGCYYVGRHATGWACGSPSMKLALTMATRPGGRPVSLVFHQEFERTEDAVAAERQVKGWRREKKEGLIRGDFAALPELSRRGSSGSLRASRRRAAHASSA